MAKLEITTNEEYKSFLRDLKTRIRKAQLKAAISVNTELLRFYWDLGQDIIHKQKTTDWGNGFLIQLSKDLMQEFPDMKGFSNSNLKYIRQWVSFYITEFDIQNESEISQQVVGQNQTQKSQQPVGQMQFVKIEPEYPEILSIPWGHNILIMSKCKAIEEALYYVQNTLEHNWSRSVLTHQIESGLFKRDGKAITNFSKNLPSPQSDLAIQTLKDPYLFDFIQMTKDYNERDLEKALVDHISQFLLELGAGFAYIGKQVNVQVGNRDFFLDLLFYHTRLHCYIVLELKTTEFEPEHAGKLNFYIKTVDETIRQEGDNPTIGLLICKSKEKVIAEWALSDINKPIGVSEYQLTQSLPDSLKSSLPSIEEIEAELGELND